MYKNYIYYFINIYLGPKGPKIIRILNKNAENFHFIEMENEAEY